LEAPRGASFFVGGWIGRAFRRRVGAVYRGRVLSHLTLLWVGRIGAALLAALAVLVGAAYLLPRQVSVVRTVDVAAPQTAVFALVSDLRRFGEWAPWFADDRDITVIFTGPVEGVGQTIQWESARDDIGSGRETIMRILPGREVAMEVQFGDAEPVEGWLSLKFDKGTTNVTWGMVSDLGVSPVARYLGLWVEGRVGPDLEAGLARLKALAETKPGPETG